MIHFILVVNRQGKVRLSKWYSAFEDTEKRKLSEEIHRVVNSRDVKFTNFVEFRTWKVVYRKYAGLFFCAIADADDNELAVLESLHLFVEVLDKYFETVKELDLVYYFHKVFAILDEIFLAGEIMETSKPVILNRIAQMDLM